MGRPCNHVEPKIASNMDAIAVLHDTDALRDAVFADVIRGRRELSEAQSATRRALDRQREAEHALDHAQRRLFTIDERLRSYCATMTAENVVLSTKVSGGPSS